MNYLKTLSGLITLLLAACSNNIDKYGGRMDKGQLTELVIIPTLKEIPFGYTPNAVLAVQMIIAHESLRGKYLKQVKGPALGPINMEPPTYYSTWRFGDSIRANAEKLGIISANMGVDNIPHPSRLIYDLRFNVFMARQKLFMAPGALPSDPMKMAHYLKLNWNGDGKATAQEYYDDFMLWK